MDKITFKKNIPDYLMPCQKCGESNATISVDGAPKNYRWLCVLKCLPPLLEPLYNKKMKACLKCKAFLLAKKYYAKGGPVWCSVCRRKKMELKTRYGTYGFN